MIHALGMQMAVIQCDAIDYCPNLIDGVCISIEKQPPHVSSPVSSCVGGDLWSLFSPCLPTPSLIKGVTAIFAMH